jgi:hypothetical protein
LELVAAGAADDEVDVGVREAVPDDVAHADEPDRVEAVRGFEKADELAAPVDTAAPTLTTEEADEPAEAAAEEAPLAMALEAAATRDEPSDETLAEQVLRFRGGGADLFFLVP